MQLSNLVFSLKLFEVVFFSSHGDLLTDGDLPSIRMILQSNRSLLHEKLFGYEGHDIYGTVPNVSFIYFHF
jgi:hypothetical protein